MTRTTELLKGCNESFKFEGTNRKPVKIPCGQDWLCDSCKSELKGRLDALKEEIEFLNNHLWIGTLCEDNKKQIDKRLASIQEEIKLIEDTIKT